MRMLILLCCALQCGLLSAQNWALINPDYKYNYTASGNNTLIEQVITVGDTTLGPDSSGFYLSPHSRVCDTCMAGTGGVNAWRYIDTIAPSFLGNMVTKAGSRWHWGPMGRFVVIPDAAAGSSWTLSEVPLITATAAAATWSTVFGTSDSLRSISLSNGDSLVLSKSFGIVHWPGSLGFTAGQDLALAGVHGPDVGWLIPDWTRFFPYQAGDALQYHQNYTNYPQHTYLSTDTKIKIFGRTEYADSIVFQAVVLTHRYGDQDQWHQNIDQSSSDTTVWTASGRTLAVFRMLRTGTSRFFGAIVNNYVAGSSLCGIAEYFLDDDGRTNVHPVRLDPQGTWATCSPTQISGMLALQSQSITSGSGEEQVWYTEGVGLRGYLRASVGGFGQDTLKLVGASIAGDTIGTVSPDASIFVGINGLAPASSVSVGPNPASSYLTIQGLGLEEADITIFDITGKVRSMRHLSGTRDLSLDVSGIPAGIHLLSIDQDGHRHTIRFAIAR